MSSPRPELPNQRHLLMDTTKNIYSHLKNNRNLLLKHGRQFISSLYRDQKNQTITKHLKTQPLQRSIKKQNSGLGKIQAVRIQNIRLRTHLTNQTSQQIFYRKKDCNYKRLSYEKKLNKQENRSLSLSRVKNTSLGHNSNRKIQEQDTPLMMRRRSPKLQKQMNIINHEYQSNLSNISIQDFMKTSLNFANQKNLISRMKGSKLYYQFVREWKFPRESQL